MLNSTKKGFVVCAVNLAIVFAIALPVGILWWFVEPPNRGFYCGDETLSHPLRQNTISNAVLCSVFVGIPLFIIFLVEWLSSASKDSNEKLLAVCKITVGHLFGVAVTVLLTITAIYSIGRLRPNFFAWCNPNWDDINCWVDGAKNVPRLVTNYVCKGTDEAGFAGEDQIKKAKMSFVSGHASFSCQSATFVVLYLQSKSSYMAKVLKDYYLLLPFIQVAMIVFAFFTCLSRVMDYQHHPGDVIGGGLIGVTVQIINCFYVMKILGAKDKPDDLKSPSGRTITISTGNSNEAYQNNNLP